MPTQPHPGSGDKPFRRLQRLLLRQLFSAAPSPSPLLSNGAVLGDQEEGQGIFAVLFSEYFSKHLLGQEPDLLIHLGDVQLGNWRASRLAGKENQREPRATRPPESLVCRAGEGTEKRASCPSLWVSCLLRNSPDQTQQANSYKQLAP